MLLQRPLRTKFKHSVGCIAFQARASFTRRMPVGHPNDRSPSMLRNLPPFPRTHSPSLAPHGGSHPPPSRSKIPVLTQFPPPSSPEGSHSPSPAPREGSNPQHTLHPSPLGPFLPPPPPVTPWSLTRRTGLHRQRTDHHNCKVSCSARTTKVDNQNPSKP